MIRLAAISLLGVTAHGERSAQTSLSFSAHIEPANLIAWEQYGDVLVIDALAFGVEHHRAFVVDGWETVTADERHIWLEFRDTEVAAR